MGSKHRHRDPVARFLTVLAVLLLLGGLGTAGSAGWSWWARGRTVQAAQERLAQSLDAEWAAGGGDLPGAVARGPVAMPFDGAVGGTAAKSPAEARRPLARLYVPALGLSLIVVDGVAEADLAQGPGYIPGTAPIGAAGNTGIAGHRYPGVFWDLDRLGIGAPVVLETRDTWFVYRVIEALVVRPEENSVLGPPPPGAGPLLTLVTCEPRLSTARRLIRQATLVRRDPRAGARPVELTERGLSGKVTLGS